VNYLGGKRQIAVPLAAAIRKRAGARRIWEPFCGGANMTEHLRPEVASDAHAALIAMYQALYAGWDPPREVSRYAHAVARELPDTDPRKAFIGFGCSFGGDYFCGHAGNRLAKRASGEVEKRRAARAARISLLRLRECAPNTRFEHADFLTVPPRKSTQWCIYADPPYAGAVTGYSTGAFDHAAFWERCQEWTAHGAIVLVSEYACPIPHRVVFERVRNVELKRGGEKRTERLFQVLPPWRGDR
jgi:DNA adenine methylase